MKKIIKNLFASLLSLTFLGSVTVTAETKSPWEDAYNSETGERFIPVELFTGAQWNGEHELVMKEASSTTCVSANGRLCDSYHIAGPFKTERNDTKIEWAGNEIPYYRRTFASPSAGSVESFFTINASKDGLVRIYDKRKRRGERTFTGVGSKFPLGYWRQGEVRTYPTRRPIRVEILELDGPDHCLTFRWTIGDGRERNSDNNYSFCPDIGLKSIEHANQSRTEAK